MKEDGMDGTDMDEKKLKEWWMEHQRMENKWIWNGRWKNNGWNGFRKENRGLNSSNYIIKQRSRM